MASDLTREVTPCSASFSVYLRADSSERPDVTNWLKTDVQAALFPAMLTDSNAALYFASFFAFAFIERMFSDSTFTFVRALLGTRKSVLAPLFANANILSRSRFSFA